jgi:predicted ATPase
MESKPASHPLITRVWAKNFRSIEFAEIELSPLTVLVGPNASGKSNLLDVLRFIADAVRDGLDTAITDRGGINSIGRRATGGRTYGLAIGVQFENNDFIVQYDFSIQNEKKGDYRIRREYIRVNHKNSSTNLVEIMIRDGRLIKPKLERPIGIRGDLYDRFNYEDRIKSLRFGLKDLTLRSDFANIALLIPMTSTLPDDYPIIMSIEEGIEGVAAFRRYLSHMCFYHIFPNIFREPQRMSNPHPLSERGENLASVLQDMIQRKSPFLQELKEALAYVVPGVRDIKVTQAGSFLVVELDHAGVAGNGRKAWFDLSLESDGMLRLLGLLVALLQDPPPSLIAIEEPELTIHLGAMGVLADIMKEATLRTQVLVTTHSPDLIDRLPIESIRAVTAEGGSTKVGMVADYQIRSVKEGLFLPGELHRM